VPVLVLYSFRFHDPLSNKWVLARWKAQIPVLQRRYAEWEITGVPEIRHVAPATAETFGPFESPAQVGDNHRPRVGTFLESDLVNESSTLSRQEAIRLADAIADALATALSQYKVRTTAGPLIAAACLAATICDNLVAVVRVIDSHGQGHAPTLARGLIESVIDLELVCDNHDNVKPLMLDAANGVIRVCEALLVDAKSADDVERDGLIKRLRQERETVYELGRQGVKPLRLEDKIKKVKKNPGVLRTYFWRYCQSAHNDLQALAERHLRGNTIVLGNTLADDEAIPLLAVCAGCAFHVFEFMPVFLEVSADQLEAAWLPLRPLLHRLGGVEKQFAIHTS
jgi:hypothetical protein